MSYKHLHTFEKVKIGDLVFCEIKKIRLHYLVLENKDLIAEKSFRAMVWPELDKTFEICHKQNRAIFYKIID